jgi:hypothetical protein
MTTRLPTRDQVVAVLEKVRSEPDGPDRATAIERLEAQLAELDEPGPDTLTGPDADLVEELPDEPAPPAAPAPVPAATSTPPKKAPPFGAKPASEPGKKPDAKPDNKPF